MKTIGLIGGMSWESTVPYYSIINEEVKNALGGLSSAKIVLYSVNFEEIEAYQSSGRWDKAAQALGDVAKKLEAFGADFIIICTNTMHKIAPEISAMVKIPVVHIAEATADKLLEEGMTKVALLGTKYTMQQDFYKEKLAQREIEVLIPDAVDVEIINNIIFNELCVGIVRDESRENFKRCIRYLKERGAEAVILGCTEIGMLIKQEDSVLPVFDTTYIHAKKAAELALG